MTLVPCPYCGPRNASEFRWVGAVKERPHPARTTAAEWRAYLYLQTNPAGWMRETWFHRAGCRRYVTLERDTVRNVFRTRDAAAGLPADWATAERRTS